jgi:hypothetical protein
MKIYPTIQFRMASSGNKASIINSWKMNLFLFLNSNHGQKALFFSHIQIVTYVYCTWIWTSSLGRKNQSLFLTTHDRCEINLSNDVLSSTLVVFCSSLVTLYNHNKKSFWKRRIITYWYDCCYYCSFLRLPILLTNDIINLVFLLREKKKKRRKIYRNKYIQNSS